MSEIISFKEFFVGESNITKNNAETMKKFLTDNGAKNIVIEDGVLMADFSSGSKATAVVKKSQSSFHELGAYGDIEVHGSKLLVQLNDDAIKAFG